MPYTSNPYVRKTGRDAVCDVRSGRLTVSKAARYYGVARSTIYRWVKKAPKHNRAYIETLSSRPHYHPNQLSKETVTRIVELRFKTGRCAQILHEMLRREGIRVSLSSVKRTLKRNNLTRKKKQARLAVWKIPKPKVKGLGDLVEIDTIHYVRPNGSRFYLYVLLDVFSRYGYAEYRKKLSIKDSLSVVENALNYFNFKINTVQSDNGYEFEEGFCLGIRRWRIRCRHTRIRKPNDNAHVERFNRTIQEECFGSKLPSELTINHKLQKYLNYYNKERLHLGINCSTPQEVVNKVLQRC